MTIVKVIDYITAWLNENVCPEVWLKKPPKDKNADPSKSATNDKYEYELIHPIAVPLYLTTQDKMPPGIPVYPSICVQLDEGMDDTEHREMSVILSFGAWNPGNHKEDWIGGKGTESFTAAADGWRDLWNFIDLTATKLQSTTYLGENVEIKQHDGMKFGPYKQEDSIPSYYPMWYGYLNFSIRTPLRRYNKELEDLL